MIREKFEGMPEILNPPNNNNSVEAQSSQIRAQLLYGNKVKDFRLALSQ